MTNLKLLSLLLFSVTFCFGKDVPNKKRTPIINGSIITNNQFPYQVLISGGNDGGGTILNKRWILTAAHVAASGSPLQFYAGVTNRNSLASGQNRIYKRHKPHPSYGYVSSSTSPDNDLALIEVTQPFVFNSNVDAVKLASSTNQGSWAVNQLPQVSGFGRTSSTSNVLSNELRVTSVQVTNIDNTYNKIRAGGNNPTSNGGNDSCQGDSGGPLSANGLFPNNIQLGIVSAGGTCGTVGVYMMISKYLGWITETLHLLGTPDYVCGNTTFENLARLPDGVSFSWSASPANLFSVTSGTGLSFTTSNNSNGNSGQGIVTLTVTTPAGTFTHTKQVWVGKPAPINIVTDGTFTINGSNTTLCRTFGYCMTSNANVTLNGGLVPLNTANSFSYGGWPTSNSFLNTSTSVATNDRACFGTNNTGSYFLTVYATNTCGTISRNIIVQVNSCGFRVFPNPAQTTIAVEFEEPDKIESIPDVIDLIDEKTLKKVKTKDVKALKEKEKNNPKAYGKIDFDVTDLPRGTYYLYMGFENKNGNKVEQTRIILTDK
jgi:Trypsin